MSKLSANLPLKLLSVVIGTVLWFAVLGSRNVEITKDVPIEIVTPSDLVIANEVPEKVSFRLSGPKAFLRNILNRKEDPIRINFSTAKPGLVTYRFFQDNIQVPLGVKVLSINPTAIVVKLEYLKKKEVPIKILTQGEAPAGFRITRLEVNPPTAKIKGPESKVDKIVEIPTTIIDLNQMVDSGEKDVSLDMSLLLGIGVEGDLPKLSYEVVQSTANYKIKNVDLKVLTSRKFKAVPKEITVYVRSSTEELKQVDRSKVFGVIDLHHKGPGTYELPVSVELPSTIKLIKVIPSKVKVTLF